LEDLVRVSPERFGEPLGAVIEDVLKQGYEYQDRIEGGYEGKLDKDLGLLLCVTEVREIQDGVIIPGDGAAYHNTRFEAIIFKPELQEIIDGEVVEIVEFGAFVRIGPLDGLVHVSQITDDYIVNDQKRMALVGKESGKVLDVGSRVRARIVALSLNPEKSKESKINLTMRQPGLGRFEWLEEERRLKKKEKRAGETEKRSKGASSSAPDVVEKEAQG
jgi:DNA-directed RNA polymerase subunit E'